MEAVTETVQFQKYSDYKDSGVDWLGEIPAHWEVSSLGSLMELKSNKKRPDLQVLSVYREYGVIPKDSRDDNHNATSSDTSTYKAVEPGYLVVNKMKAWQGSMGISSYEGIVSPAYITCKISSDKVMPYFLHQLLRSDNYIGEYNRLSYGVRVGQWDMHYEDFKKISVVLPPLTEQTRIAEFLDRKTAQIDEAIAKKERLIELLNERRQVMINRAVTRGLNPDVPLKDSGIEWIGEIPAHWEVSRLKFITKVQSGLTLGKVYVEKSTISVPYLRVANVQDGYFDLNDIIEINIPRRIMYDFLLRKNDILVTEGGDIDKLGRGTVWNEEIKPCLHQNHVFAVRIQNEVISPNFIALLLGCNYGKKYFAVTANKTTNLASTNKTKLGNFPVLIVPQHEQEEILQVVEKLSNSIETAKEKAQRQIQKLQELKATLINSAVTGKIRV